MEDFQSIIEEHHPILYKIGRAYAQPEEFDDLYQEMLINIWKGLKNFRGEAKLSTWLYRVVLNTALSFQRSNKKQNALNTPLEDAHHLHTETHEQDDRQLQMYAAIRQLKESERSVILLYLEEKSYEDIAEILGISSTNVGVKINRIKKKLFQFLTEQTHG